MTYSDEIFSLVRVFLNTLLRNGTNNLVKQDREGKQGDKRQRMSWDNPSRRAFPSFLCQEKKTVTTVVSQPNSTSSTSCGCFMWTITYHFIDFITTALVEKHWENLINVYSFTQQMLMEHLLCATAAERQTVWGDYLALSVHTEYQRLIWNSYNTASAPHCSYN